MSYIGNKPTAVPLTSADLEDNIISTAKIQDNAVTAAKYVEAPSFRNLIINGDMSIAQRGTSVSSITSSGYRTMDRWYFNTDLGTWTMSQETDVPTGQGFAKSLKLDCTTANASPSAGNFLVLEQKIEGQMLQQLKKGTSNAESLTLSFWVKSSKTGTYIAELFDNDNSRQISQAYTINSASTWEKKTLTFAGDTTGTLNNDNGLSLTLALWLGGGSTWTSGTLNTSWNSNTNANRAVGVVNLADNTANNFYITGVQLEVGTSASDFEFLPYDVNLQRCKRYYMKLGNTTNDYSFGRVDGTNFTYGIWGTVLPTTMRATPSGTLQVDDSNSGFSSISLAQLTTDSVAVDATSASWSDIGTVEVSAEL